MGETTKTPPQPSCDLGAEKISFTRTDGKTTEISLLELLDQGSDFSGMLWVVMLKLHEVTDLLRVQIEQTQVLLQLANQKPQIPSADESLRQALGAIGLKPEDLQAAMRQATAGANGVTVTKPGGEG